MQMLRSLRDLKHESWVPVSDVAQNKLSRIIQVLQCGGLTNQGYIMLQVLGPSPSFQTFHECMQA